MKPKFLSVVMLLCMAFLFMSVSVPSPDAELESSSRFWGSEETSTTVCGESNTGTFCCTTTTVTTYYVFWIATSHDYDVDVECI